MLGAPTLHDAPLNHLRTNSGQSQVATIDVDGRRVTGTGQSHRQAAVCHGLSDFMRRGRRGAEALSPRARS